MPWQVPGQGLDEGPSPFNEGDEGQCEESSEEGYESRATTAIKAKANILQKAMKATTAMKVNATILHQEVQAKAKTLQKAMMAMSAMAAKAKTLQQAAMKVAKNLQK